MKLKPVKYTLPESWACALINNDFSGFDNNESDERDLRDWLAKNPQANIVSCGEFVFFQRFKAASSTLARNCLDYESLEQG